MKRKFLAGGLFLFIAAISGCTVVDTTATAPVLVRRTVMVQHIYVGRDGKEYATLVPETRYYRVIPAVQRPVAGQPVQGSSPAAQPSDSGAHPKAPSVQPDRGNQPPAPRPDAGTETASANPAKHLARTMNDDNKKIEDALKW